MSWVRTPALLGASHCVGLKVNVRLTNRPRRALGEYFSPSSEMYMLARETLSSHMSRNCHVPSALVAQSQP